MFKHLQSNAAGGSDKEAAAPKSALMIAVKDTPEAVKKSRGGFAFEFSDGVGNADGRRGIKNKMQMVCLPVGLDDFTLDFRGRMVQSLNHKVSL